MWRRIYIKNSIQFHISIHTSRAGCDSMSKSYREDTLISIHTSRAGCDIVCSSCYIWVLYFNSHIPCGMWWDCFVTGTICFYFNSHIPCGMWCSSYKWLPTLCTFQFTHPVRDVIVSLLERFVFQMISIHTSRAGCDEKKTHSFYEDVFISIHTSRAGCDSYTWSGCTNHSNFNSHIPCGMW